MAATPSPSEPASQPRTTTAKPAATSARAAAESGALAPAAQQIKLERVRPARTKQPTLRFLKANRDFIRGRFDLLREKALAGARGSEAIDPRYLAYAQMLEGIRSAGDSAAAADRARGGLDLLASVTELGLLEAELDLMDRLLADQRSRLGALQADFTGRQHTELIVVLSGHPTRVEVADVAIGFESAPRVTVALTPEQRELLRTGGVVEVFHGFIEPREQVIDLSLSGAEWPAGSEAFVTLVPARDRKTMLRFHLTAVDARGAESIEASTWLHDERLGSQEP